MHNKLCKRYIVSGKVQGVWFRAFVQENAKELGLTGWVRNVADGSVELIACGEADKFPRLLQALKTGPENAKVIGVQEEDIPWQEHSRFAIK